MGERKAYIEESDKVIARIENQNNPAEVVTIRYLREENGFVTSGIYPYFGQREILIPVRLVAADLHLVGAIIAALLERLSVARETGSVFVYASRFQVLDSIYTLHEHGEYMKLEKG